MKLYISAMNVHHGGGRTLLTALLEALPADIATIALLDARMPVPGELPPNVSIKPVTPSICARLSAERWLAKNVRADDTVICLGNLPPVFKLNGAVTVFLQNRYLVDGTPLKDFPFKVRLRLWVERIWLARAASHAQAFIVQTPAMKAALLASGVTGTLRVSVRPFVSRDLSCGRRRPSQRQEARTKMHNFLYVASGEPHKNHRRLIEAWRLLAHDGLYPALHLTVGEEAPSLRTWIDQQRQLHRLEIVNHGILPPAQMDSLYRSATALIYPSTIESFGLPLVEARNAGLPILASEADYVRDLIDPEESFDPSSAVSIMRSVKRFMGLTEAGLPLMDARAFIDKLRET